MGGGRGCQGRWGALRGGAIPAKPQGKWFCKVRRVGKLRLGEAESLPRGSPASEAHVWDWPQAASALGPARGESSHSLTGPGRIVRADVSEAPATGRAWHSALTDFSGFSEFTTPDSVDPPVKCG